MPLRNPSEEIKWQVDGSLGLELKRVVKARGYICESLLKLVIKAKGVHVD